MKDRTIRNLLIAIAVLGAAIFAQEYWKAQALKRNVVRRQTFGIDLGSLSSLQFKTTNSVVLCSKKDGLWVVGESTSNQQPVDVALFYKLVAALNSTTNSTIITAGELDLRGFDYSEYGFDVPMCEIVAVDNQGNRTWKIGRPSTLGDEVYVKQVGLDEIHAVTSKILRLVPTKPDLLRNRVLFATGKAGAKRVEVRGSSGFIRIAKESSSQWRITQPIVAQADPSEVSAYIEQLKKIRIQDFLEENVSDFSAYGLQSEGRQISLGNSDGSSCTLVLGDPVPGRPGLVYARRADDTSVFALKEDVLNLLDASQDRFRDARIVTIPAGSISSISIQHQGKRVLLDEYEQGRWKIMEPAVWEAEPDTVYNLIDLWGHAVITDFDVPSSSAVCDWCFEFASADTSITNRIEVLDVGDRKDGLIVRINGDPALFQINLPLIPDSIANPLVYKNRYVWNLNRKEINKLVLQKEDSPKQAVDIDLDGIHAAAESAGNISVDAMAVNRTLDKLCTIRTSEYIAYNPRSLDVYGLSTPALTVHVGLSGSNELGRVLLIGRESTDGYYSMIKGRDVVFYLDKDTVDAISSDLVVKSETPAPMAE